MKQKRILIVIAGVGILVAGLIGYRTYNKPHRNIAAEKAAYKLTADALFDAFETDESAANTKYLDAVIEVEGVLEEVSRNTDDVPVYTLEAENALIGGISATLNGEETHDPSIRPGDSVRLKCRCTGKLMDVVLVDCSVINTDK